MWYKDDKKKYGFHLEDKDQIIFIRLENEPSESI